MTMRGALTTIAAVLLGLWAAAYYGLDGAAAFCVVVIVAALLAIASVAIGTADEERDQ